MADKSLSPPLTLRQWAGFAACFGMSFLATFPGNNGVIGSVWLAASVVILALGGRR